MNLGNLLKKITTNLSNKVNKSGDTMTGALTINMAHSGGTCQVQVKSSANSRAVALLVGADGSNSGLYDVTNSEWIIDAPTAGGARIPSWASTGSATQPVYINSSGEAVACTGVQTAAVTPVSTYASLSGSYSRLKIVGNMAFLSISLSMQAISAQSAYIEIANIPSEYAPNTDWYFTAMERNTEKAHFMVVLGSGKIQIYPRSAAIASGAILRGSTSWVIDN